MNTHQLRNFISIAQTLNYSETAKSAFISQPALTKQINRLEAELGVVLFERSRHNVSLTYAGEEFYKYATEIIDSVQRAEARMTDISSGRTGFLKISSVYSMESLLSRSVSAFNDRYPEVSVSILVGTGISQIMTIRKMSYDVFFSFTDLLDSFSNIRTVPLPPDRFAVYLQKKYSDEYLSEGYPFLNRLHHFVELSSEGPFLTNKTFSLMDTMNLASDNIVYYPSSAAMLVAVQAGLGFSLLPTEMNLGAIPDDIEVFPLDLPEAVISRSAGWLAGNKNSAVKNFAELLSSLADG